MEGFFKAMVLFAAINMYELANKHIQTMSLFPLGWNAVDAILAFVWLVPACIIAGSVLSANKKAG